VRRNRLNDALKEMQALIAISSDTIMKELTEESPAVQSKDGMKSNSSKAATVESAIQQIKVLKEGQAAQRTVMMALRRQYERMRRQLGDDVAATEGLGVETLEAAINGASEQSPAAPAVEVEAK
jgi:hypothetical protein